MIHSIAQILKINNEADLLHTLELLDEQYSNEIKPLREALARNVFSMDPTTLEAHAGMVDSWRDRAAHFLMLIEALTEHAKSDRFELPKEKGVTEEKRKMHIRTLAGGFEAWGKRMEHLIRSIDSRVNLCKKLMGIESEAVNTYKRVA